MDTLKTLRLAIFDCDGTLVDSQHLIVGSIHDACRSQGLEIPSPAAIRSTVGLPLETGIGRLWPEAESGLIEKLAASYRMAFRERRSNSAPEPLYAGIPELLEKLRAEGVALAVATGKSRRGLHHILDIHGLRGHFMSLKSADDGPGKPHPAILEQAMDECGVEAHQTVMIGDTSFDIEAGRNAGATSLGVNWGYHDRETLLECGAAEVFETSAALGSWLISRLSQN